MIVNLIIIETIGLAKSFERMLNRLSELVNWSLVPYAFVGK
jgi:hypothetical protein